MSGQWWTRKMRDNAKGLNRWDKWRRIQSTGSSKKLLE
jgi:hypothetical protein